MSTELRHDWRKTPATLVILGAALAGFLLVYLPFPTRWVAALTFAPFRLTAQGPVFGPLDGEYWRLVTPVFLHFGWLHIVFNGLWCWDLGGRIERTLGSTTLVGLFFAIALCSNAAQYLYTGPVLFGGLSGVVYGFLGFSWVAGRLCPRWQLQPPPAIMALMVGWLLLCMAGVVELLGFGAIANAAHLGGLVSGAALGAALAVVYR